MKKLNTYTSKGTKGTSVNFPKNWEEKENMVLLAQAIRVYEARCHPGLSKTKTRGEVKASTRKIYRQKGTGGARHGARSAPIFVGGGKAHGPKGVVRELNLPKKMRQKALKVALSIKASEARLIVVNSISTIKKTKEAAKLLKKIISSEKEVGKNARFLFVLSEKNKSVRLALRNIENVETISFKDLNVHRVYLGGVVILDNEVFTEKQNMKIEKSKKDLVVKEVKSGKTKVIKPAGKKAKSARKSK